MSGESGANEFQNVSGAAEGENELAQQLNQSIPQVNANVVTTEAPTQGNASGPPVENTAAPVQNTAAPVENTAAPAQEAPPVTTSGYVMSAKAKDLQERRKALFKEMQAEYARVFGDDKKAPKAKMYHAAGLLTIKERDGDAAYSAKLQEYIQANQGKYGNKTRKVEKPANNANNSAATVANTSSPAESGKTIIRTIETMAAKVKEMVDTMVSTTKTLVKSDKPDMAAIAERVVRFANESTTAKKPRKVRSNKGSTHKSKKAKGSETVNV